MRKLKTGKFPKVFDRCLTICGMCFRGGWKAPKTKEFSIDPYSSAKSSTNLPANTLVTRFAILTELLVSGVLMWGCNTKILSSIIKCVTVYMVCYLTIKFARKSKEFSMQFNFGTLSLPANNVRGTVPVYMRSPSPLHCPISIRNGNLRKRTISQWQEKVRLFWGSFEQRLVHGMPLHGRSSFSILALILALVPASCLAQNARWDYMTLTTQAQGGNLLPVYTIPGSAVSFYACSGGTCTTLANTYNTATSTSPCSSGSQIVLQGSAACVSTADPQGNFGAWFQGGQYMAQIVPPTGGSFQYFFTVSAGGSGGVSSLNATGYAALTGAVVLNCGGGLSCTQAGNIINISPTVAFTINSFTGCAGTVELGTAIVNPVFAATYSTTPASAYITNTAGINSPFTMTSPFASATVTGTFTHTTTATTTFTLSATQGSTQTANCSDTWQPRIFAGIGTTGATSSVTSSGTSAILSTGNALSGTALGAGLGAESVGQVFGPYAPSGQNVYLLLTGGSHTFTDNCTGFPFSFNSPLTVTFVNSQGTTLTMYLYGSTNPLTGSCFSPKIAS